jgi:hypothetical protein
VSFHCGTVNNLQARTSLHCGTVIDLEPTTALSFRWLVTVHVFIVEPIFSDNIYFHYIVRGPLRDLFTQTRGSLQSNW